MSNVISGLLFQGYCCRAFKEDQLTHLPGEFNEVARFQPLLEHWDREAIKQHGQFIIILDECKEGNN